ncbi:MAG: internal scaffolding protein [Wigfec virus K19_174]|nr:MAG: internal scaffolding protein [Wigfec virus K19_174]
MTKQLQSKNPNLTVTLIGKRKRVQLVCSETSITDPDAARELSMASVIKKLEKGFNVPLTADTFSSLTPLKYTNLQDCLDFHQQVTQTFESLPSDLRKLMGNDLRNFEDFIHDPKNQQTLLDYGLASKPDASNSQILEALKSQKPAQEDSKTPSNSNKT